MEKIKILKEKYDYFIQNVQKHNISEFAAQCAYYIILSFIPFIMLILTLIQYVGIDKENLFIIIKSIIPSTMNETILGIIQEVYSKSIGTISISLVFVVWAAGKGFYSLCKGLRVIYGNKRKQNYFSLKIMSIICTITFSLLIVITLVLMVFGKSFNLILEEKINSAHIFGFIMKLRYLIIPIGLFVFLLLVYRFIPISKNKFKDQIPGSIVTLILWLIISKIFSIYLSLFKGFSIMYGSLTTVMLIMMWVYFCIYAILIGAEINKILLNNKK